MQNQFFSLSEARRFVALGLPVFVAQMSQMGMNFVDTAMTGQASTADMAAVAVAGSIWNPLSLLGIGCLLSLPAMSAHLVGGGQRSRTPHLLRQGIWLTLVISAILMTAFYVISWHLQSFGLDEELSRLGGGYLRAMLWGLPGFMLFVDDLTYIPAGHERLKIQGYNVYCNGKRVNDEVVTATSYSHKPGTDGIHTYSVATQYNLGQSPLADVNIDFVGLNSIGAEGLGVERYAADGLAIYRSTADSDMLRISAPAGVYAVRIGTRTFKVIVR